MHAGDDLGATLQNWSLTTIMNELAVIEVEEETFFCSHAVGVQNKHEAKLLAITIVKVFDSAILDHYLLQSLEDG